MKNDYSAFRGANREWCEDYDRRCAVAADGNKLAREALPMLALSHHSISEVVDRAYAIAEEFIKCRDAKNAALIAEYDEKRAKWKGESK